MKPSVTRNVHYGTHNSSNEPLAAIITRCQLLAPDEAPPEPNSAYFDNEDRWNVTLRVFDADGPGTYMAFRVPFSKTLQPGHWTWPPRV